MSSHAIFSSTIRRWPGSFAGGFSALTWGTAIAAVTGIILALARRRHLFGLGLPEWIFLALVLITGPGLIANTVLKDNWARPRPLHVTEFGGPEQFTPVLERSGACQRNCSFVSGEASATFALGFAIAMLARRRRAELMAAAVAVGSIAGLIRMGEGGHFLSDVVFAAVFMALDVALMYWLVFHVLAHRTRDEAWWHEKTLAVIGKSYAANRRTLSPAADIGSARNSPRHSERTCPEGSSRKGDEPPLGDLPAQASWTAEGCAHRCGAFRIHRLPKSRARRTATAASVNSTATAISIRRGPGKAQPPRFRAYACAKILPQPFQSFRLTWSHV